MLTEGLGDLAYLKCKGIYDGRVERVPASVAFAAGWVCVNPVFYADVFEYRASLQRWIAKHCN